MPSIISDVKSFISSEAWGAKDIAEIDGAIVRLHWTDEPYIWHVNDGPEVFVVLDGQVNMHYKLGGDTKIVELSSTDIFFAQEGDEHVAYPLGEARILVIERKGSI